MKTLRRHDITVEWAAVADGDALSSSLFNGSERYSSGNYRKTANDDQLIVGYVGNDTEVR